jgi:hypothetical protein
MAVPATNTLAPAPKQWSRPRCEQKWYEGGASVGGRISAEPRAHLLLTRFRSYFDVVQADAAVHLDVEERETLAEQPNLHR